MSRWTTKTPTKPGYYWALPGVESTAAEMPQVILVEHEAGGTRLVAFFPGNECEETDLRRILQWSGPLRLPRGDQ